MTFRLCFVEPAPLYTNAISCVNPSDKRKTSNDPFLTSPSRFLCLSDLPLSSALHVTHTKTFSISQHSYRMSNKPSREACHEAIEFNSWNEPLSSSLDLTEPDLKREDFPPIPNRSIPVSYPYGSPYRPGDPWGNYHNYPHPAPHGYTYGYPVSSYSSVQSRYYTGEDNRSRYASSWSSSSPQSCLPYHPMGHHETIHPPHHEGRRDVQHDHSPNVDSSLCWKQEKEDPIPLSQEPNTSFMSPAALRRLPPNKVTPPRKGTSGEIRTPKDEDVDPPSTSTLIWKLGPYDIVCGRGAPITWNEGNRIFLKLIDERRTEYLCSRRSDKPRVATHILELIKAKGGRFVRRVTKVSPYCPPSSSSSSQDHDHGLLRFGWEEIEERRAYEKICQSLRERPPPTADGRRPMVAVVTSRQQNKGNPNRFLNVRNDDDDEDHPPFNDIIPHRI